MCQREGGTRPQNGDHDEGNVFRKHFHSCFGLWKSLESFDWIYSQGRAFYTARLIIYDGLIWHFWVFHLLHKYRFCLRKAQMGTSCAKNSRVIDNTLPYVGWVLRILLWYSHSVISANLPLHFCMPIIAKLIIREICVKHLDCTYTLLSTY